MSTRSTLNPQPQAVERKDKHLSDEPKSNLTGSERKINQRKQREPNRR